MKNLFTIILFFLISISGFCQTFDFTIQSDTVYFSSQYQIKHCYAYLNNNSNDSIDVDIIRVVNDGPPNWTNGMCADTVCYFVTTDSIHVVIPPNGHVEFRPGFQLFNDTTIVIAKAIYEMKNKTHHNNQVVSHAFYAINNNVISSDTEVELKAAFKIFPNPASDFISIETDVSIKQVRLFDLQGKLILQQQSESKLLNVGFLKNGIYLLEINSEEGKVVKKIVKE